MELTGYKSYQGYEIALGDTLRDEDGVWGDVIYIDGVYMWKNKVDGYEKPLSEVYEFSKIMNR